MSQDTLDLILERLPTLDEDELERLQLALQNQRAADEEEKKRQRFHEALLKSGLVKEIKSWPRKPRSDRRMFSVQGKPVSETIIEERR